jgi:hypothetical protein
MSLSVLSPLQKEVLNAFIPEAEKEIARRDSNVFCERVLKDEKGQHVQLAEIHREINWHIDECRKRKLNCGILAPWRHGKTEGVVIARTLQFLGEDPNNRVFIVCNSDDNAAARVGSVSRYIERDEDYHSIYPGIRPGKSSDWGKHKLVVQRESNLKDGSVEAWGINSSGTGAGCDFLIVDDPVDLRNAILNPALRPQVKDSFRNVWSSRVSPNGFKIYIATAWHDDDLTSELKKNPEWCFLIIKVSQGFDYFECESPLKGKFTIPLWDAWPKEKLITRFKEIGSRAFNRGYRQEALSDEDRTFPSSDKIFDWSLSRDIIKPEWPRVLGIDPFGQSVVIFVLAFNPINKMRFPIEIKRGHWAPNRTKQEIIDSYLKHMPQLLVVENNAAQQAIIQWVGEVGGVDIPIVPFTTGVQKANPEIGLPSLEVEFANGAWVVPMAGVDEFDAENPFNIWRRELKGHPVAEASDTVMASWFAREGVRFLTQKFADSNEQEIYTQEEVLGTEPVTIGEY